MSKFHPSGLFFTLHYVMNKFDELNDVQAEKDSKVLREQQKNCSKFGTFYNRLNTYLLVQNKLHTKQNNKI